MAGFNEAGYSICSRARWSRHDSPHTVQLTM